MYIIEFTPNNTQDPPFVTTITMDGESYEFQCFWNVTGKRWYYRINDQAGNLIINAPLISSPLHYDILLAPGIFLSSTLIYRAPSNNFEVNP